MKQKYNFSINLGLSTAFAFVVIITSICVTIVSFINIHSVMRQDLNKRIHDILAIGKTKIDTETHASLTKPEQEASSDYTRIKKTLQEIRNGGTDIRFVYTLRRVGTHRYQFIVDAEEKEQDVSHLGDEYKGFDIEAFYMSKDLFYISDQFYVDQWGTWLTGYAKLTAPEGITDSLLCVDISAKSIREREEKAIADVFIIELLITLAFIGLGIFIATRIAKPLSLLEQDMICIKDFKLDVNIPITSQFKEIMSMKNAEDNMKIGLQSFKKYVPADLVSQLIKLNKEAKLGGEKKELTILFSDIANFTSVAEKLSPEQLSEYMAEYFEGLTSIIIKHKGTVDKYIGDAIMAFWGAPSDMNDHAIHACLAVLECQQFLSQMNAKFRDSGKPELLTRFGINSGEVIVGNFGYQERFNYTALGDNVNLASRLEGINKLYNTSNIISESTFCRITDVFACRKIDIVAVKGKTIGVPIFELISLTDDLSPEQRTFLDLSNQGMELYLARKWEEAISILKKAQQIIPDDLPSRIIIKRCDEFIQNPPPKEWQGIMVLHDK